MMKIYSAFLMVFFTLTVSKLLLAGTADDVLVNPNSTGGEASGARVEACTEMDEVVDLDYIRAKERIYEQKFAEAIPFLELVLKRDPKSAHLNNELAKAYAQVGDLEKAIACGQKAIEGEPTKVDYRFNLAEALTAAKNYKEAKAQYLKVVELEPTNQRAGLSMAMIESELGDDNKAIDQLTKLVNENPESPLSLFYRARLYIEKNKITEAKADLERCLVLRPSFVEAGTALGLIFEKTNDIEEAIRVYSKIEGEGQFKKRLAFLYIQKNQLSQALESLLEYETSQPDDYTARVKLGLLHFELKNYDKAKDQFLQILKEQPSSDNVHFYLGWVYQAKKEWNLALGEFKKVTKDSALFEESMLHAGFIYKETNRTKEGLAFTKSLIKKHKEIPEFYDLQASLFEAEKNFNEALKTLEAGLVQVKNDEKLLYFQAALFDKMGRSEKAIGIMKKLIETNPEHAHALNFIAYYYADRGEHLVEAEEKAMKALTIRPNDGYIQDTLAWIKFKKGEFDEALAKIEKASELIPDEAIVYEHLGDIYSAKNNKEKAQVAYKKAVSLAKGKDKDMIQKVEHKLAILEGPLNATKKENRLPSTEKAE